MKGYIAMSNNIEFVCPQCREILEIDAGMIGQEGQCPSCSTFFTVTDPRVAKETSKKTFRVNRSGMQAYEPPSAPVQPKAVMPISLILSFALILVITICGSITAIVIVTANKNTAVQNLKTENSQTTDLLNRRIAETEDLYRQKSKLVSENSELKNKIEQLERTKSSFGSINSNISEGDKQSQPNHEQTVRKLVNDFVKCRLRGEGVTSEKVYFTTSGFKINRGTWDIWKNSGCTNKDFLNNIIKWEFIDFSMPGENKDIAKVKVSILHGGNNSGRDNYILWTFFCVNEGGEWKISMFDK
jgi:hypothetical protein